MDQREFVIETVVRWIIRDSAIQRWIEEYGFVREDAAAIVESSRGLEIARTNIYYSRARYFG